MYRCSIFDYSDVEMVELDWLLTRFTLRDYVYLYVDRYKKLSPKHAQSFFSRRIGSYVKHYRAVIMLNCYNKRAKVLYTHTSHLRPNNILSFSHKLGCGDDARRCYKHQNTVFLLRFIHGLHFSHILTVYMRSTDHWQGGLTTASRNLLRNFTEKIV